MITNYKITDVGNNTMSSELTEFLGIDRYIAQIIGSAATKLSSNIDNVNEKLQKKNYITRQVIERI
jgi:hypothetical protein